MAGLNLKDVGYAPETNKPNLSNLGYPFTGPEDPRDISPIESIAGGAVQGALFEYGDELAGATGATWDMVTGEGFNYAENRDAARKYFKQLEAQNPTSYLAGNVGGAILSPANKILGGAKVLGQLGKLGKYKDAGRFALEGAIFGSGLSDAKTVGGIAGDALTGGAIGGIGGAVAKKGLDKLGKGYRAAHKFLIDPVKQKETMIKAAHIAGDMPKEFAEYIAKNPEDFERFGKEVVTVDDLSFTVADKINNLRKNTDEIYSKLDEILTDDPTIHFPSIKKVVKEHFKSSKINPKGKAGAKIQAINQSFLDRLQYRIKEYHGLFNEPVTKEHKEFFKVSPKALRKIVLDLGEEIRDVSASSLKTPSDLAYIQNLNKKLRLFTTKQMVKDPNIGKEYALLMKRAADHEELWNRLSFQFKLTKPSHVERLEGMTNFSKRANLEPSTKTESALKVHPSRNIKFYRLLDKFDKGLKKDIEIFGIDNRTKGGVARGSRNVQFGSKVGALVGAGAGGFGGSLGGGLGGSGIGAAVGYGVGQAVGGGVGYLADRLSRKVAKQFLIKWIPKIGSTSRFNKKLAKFSPEKLEQLTQYIKTNNGAGITALLMSKEEEK